jgi:hypothetical protein
VANVPNRTNFPVRAFGRDAPCDRASRRRNIYQPGAPSKGTQESPLRFIRTFQLEEELSMDGIIYLVGLIVIVMAVLSLFGLR